MKNLRGRNCLITGAASGIGRSLALGLAGEGMTLMLVDINLSGLEKVKKEIEDMGGRAYAAKCDVSSFDELKALEADARARLGAVDLLINNAGRGGVAGLVEELDPRDFKQVLDVNLWSVLYSVRTFLPGMIERGTGHIVNVASGAGVVGLGYGIAYVVSKFGVVGYTEALYSEIKHVHPGIDVSIICPTGVRTNIFDRVVHRMPRKLVAGVTEDEFQQRIEEYRRILFESEWPNALDPDKAAKKYIKGIKKGKLYIFDTIILTMALFAKSNDTLYRWALRQTAGKKLKLIKDALTQMGITGNAGSRAG